jgi:S1-C subfamily serine protease
MESMLTTKKTFLKKTVVGIMISVLVFANMLVSISCSLVSTLNSYSSDAANVSVKGLADASGAMETLTTLENSDLRDEDNEIRAIVDKIGPSVVDLIVIFNQADSSGNKQGEGAGIIYSADGYIITNNHVAGNTAQIVVTLNDNSTVSGKLVAGDPITDVAVVKIDKPGLKPAEMASSDIETVGNFCLAAGSPFGIQQTVTHGIISGMNRGVPVSANSLPYADLIQTDAPINPGNSGGPLVNSDGQVIGMNTLGISPAGSSSGINFAIPSDIFVNIANQIIKTGAPQIPFIGINLGSGAAGAQGTLLASTVPGAGAEKAGLKPGDIITGFNGRDIGNPYELLGAIERSNVGDNIKIKYIRDGVTNTISINLVKRPADAGISSI